VPARLRAAINAIRLTPRCIALGLVAATACSAAITGVVVAGHSSAGTLYSSTSTQTPGSKTLPPPPLGHGRRLGRHGVVATVVAISAANQTLTLRTLFGSVTVTTSSSTTYTRERHTIAFADIHVNDVVAVRGTPSGGSNTTPPTSIAATRITVEMPRLGGRVQSVNGDVITVVTPDGQLGYVTTSASTSYYQDGASASSSAVTPGAFIAAEGSRSDLAHLSADIVVVLPALRHGPGPMQPPARAAAPGQFDFSTSI